jgi:hypothetical protein
MKTYSKDRFLCEILLTSTDKATIFWQEQYMIAQNINNPFCLNRHYVDPNGDNSISNISGLKSWVKDNTRKYAETCPGDGWVLKGLDHSSETRTKMSLAAKGKRKTPEHIQKLKDSRVGIKLGPASAERKKKASYANTGNKWWSNGSEFRYSKQSPGPEWYQKGRPDTQEQIEQKRARNIGRSYYHNGIEERMLHECPGPDWIPGRLYYAGKIIESALNRYKTRVMPSM